MIQFRFNGLSLFGCVLRVCIIFITKLLVALHIQDVFINAVITGLTLVILPLCR